MSKEDLTFKACDRMVRDFEDVIKKPVREPSSVYYTGVDLGTACVVLAVLDEHLRPVPSAMRMLCGTAWWWITSEPSGLSGR